MISSGTQNTAVMPSDNPPAMSGAILFSFLLKSTNDPGALAIYIAGFEPLIALATIQIFLGGELTLQKIIGSLFTVAGITILSL